MVRHSLPVVYRCSMIILFISLLGFFVSEVADAGVNHWTNTGPEGGIIYALAIDPQTPTTVYAGTYEGGVYKSTNGGGDWTSINTGLTGNYICALAIDPQTPTTVYVGSGSGGVFKSTNGGENWSAVKDMGVYSLAIDPNTPTTIYVGTIGGRVSKSTNGGESWSAMSTGLTNNEVFVLAIDPNTPATVYAGTYGGGVFKSTNGGENWTAMNTGFSGSDSAYYIMALSIDPNAPATVYAGTGSGVYKSTNGGENWTAMNTGLQSSYTRDLTIDPNAPATVYAGTSGGVYKSTNGGENWTAMNTGLTNTSAWSMAVDPNTPTTVYAGTRGGVFKSSNGGESWSAMNTGLTNKYVLTLAIDPINTNILYAGTYANGVFKIEQETCPAPGVFSNPSPSNQATNVSTTLNFYWSGSSNADSYDVYLGTTSDPTTLVGSSITTDFPLTGLSLSTTYYWKIVARNNCGQSTPGPVWSFSTVQPSSEDCAYTISPTNKTFNPNGGSVSIKVSATGLTNCPVPLVVEDAEWISVSGTPTWKGNKGTVKMVVQKNPGSQSRTGVVSIGGETLTIEQGGAKCQLTALKPSSGKYPNTGGSGSFDITVSPQDCSWNVAAPLDWIHLDTTTGTGSGTAAFHIDANGTGKNRTGKIDVSLAQNATKKKTFTVNESK
jgi:photosystem II stability/assembly factor-like uncharacterized protein